MRILVYPYVLSIAVRDRGHDARVFGAPDHSPSTSRHLRLGHAVRERLGCDRVRHGFPPSSAGTVTTIRFDKGAGNTGGHTG
jgi:hypothetical protein